jgi:hypothetical protein
MVSVYTGFAALKTQAIKKETGDPSPFSSTTGPPAWMPAIENRRY